MKIVVGGQLEQEKIEKTIKKIAPDLEIKIMSDMDAATALQNKEADYYIGSCNTGGGGALAMAIAMNGAENCVSISTPSLKMSKAEIEKEIHDGKVAFGIITDALDEQLPQLIEALKAEKCKA